MDMNVICALPGDEIFLYDTSAPAAAPERKDRDLQMWSYYNRIMFPDEMVWKLSKPIAKRIRRARLQRLRHPVRLLRLLRQRLKER